MERRAPLAWGVGEMGLLLSFWVRAHSFSCLKWLACTCRLAWILFVLPTAGVASEPVLSAGARASVELGRALFFDKALSADGKVACVTCHRPEVAFSSGEAIPRGVFGRVGTRNVPSLLGLEKQGALFWDGRRATLEELVLDPLTTPVEHGFSDMEQVLPIVRARHSPGFARAFPGEGITPATVARALAAYVRSLVGGPSRLERHLAGQADALSASERRGLALFSGRAACSRCHPFVEEAHSDGDFHPGEVATPASLSQLAAIARSTARMSPEARRAAVSTRSEVAALGRFIVTLRPDDIGRFRTPSLRNVALTAPYMHDGSIPTLAEAVERELYYRTEGGLRVGDLTPSEREDLVAFLHSMTSSTFATVPAAAASAPSTFLNRSSR
ncbi:cytochrome c peroxidase [Myxococcus hansupus]|uniref:cytochrome-c peroxidase n=1 Tax=Pseudomyxococcus hansupus TaxID=1297742 RepID=UPI0009E5EBEB